MANFTRGSPCVQAFARIPACRPQPLLFVNDWLGEFSAQGRPGKIRSVPQFEMIRALHEIARNAKIADIAEIDVQWRAIDDRLFPIR
jgi:hypothetical protein